MVHCIYYGVIDYGVSNLALANLLNASSFSKKAS